MTSKTLFPLALCLVAGLLLIACGGGASDNAANSSNTNAAAGNTNKAANTSTTSTSGDKIGVAECDDFLAKYESCVSGKVPAQAQAAFKTSMEQWRKAWKEQAANPQTKAALASICKSAADQAKTSLGAYQCSW